MKRIEVRLADVLAKMQDSMPGRAAKVIGAPHANLEHHTSEQPPVVERSLPRAEFEVLVRHIAEAERRAASAEAQLQANDVMTGLLRERIAALQAQLDAPSIPPGTGDVALSQSLGRLVAEIREFRKQFEEMERNGVRHDAHHRVTARVTYDTALISLGAAAGIGSRFKLGASLTPRDRTRLARALADAGLDVLG